MYEIWDEFDHKIQRFLLTHHMNLHMEDKLSLNQPIHLPIFYQLNNQFSNFVLQHLNYFEYLYEHQL